MKNLTLCLVASTLLLTGCIAKASDCSNEHTIKSVKQIIAETAATKVTEYTKSEDIAPIKEMGIEAIVDHIKINYARSDKYEKEIDKYFCVADVSFEPKNADKFIKGLDGLEKQRNFLLSYVYADYGFAQDTGRLYSFMKEKYNPTTNSLKFEIAYSSQKEKGSEEIVSVELSGTEVTAIQATLVWGFSAHNKTSEIDILKHRDQIKAAVSDFLKVNREDGVEGAMNEVRKCYLETKRQSSESRSVYCLSFDTVSSQYISFIEQQNGWPRTEFFKLEAYADRAASEFKKMGVPDDKDVAGKMQKAIQSEVNSALDEAVGKP